MQEARLDPIVTQLTTERMGDPISSWFAFLSIKWLYPHDFFSMRRPDTNLCITLEINVWYGSPSSTAFF